MSKDIAIAILVRT